MLTVIKIHIIYTFSLLISKNYSTSEPQDKTGGGERYQQHKQHKPTTIARVITHCVLRGIEGQE